jgi:hypothetical protein
MGTRQKNATRHGSKIGTRMDQPVSASSQHATTEPSQAFSPVRRSWARRTALLGLLVFALAVVFAILPAVRQAANVCGHGPDMTAFELARSVDDLNRVFAETQPGCRDATTKAMNHMNRVDLPFFMVVYTAFMASAALFESAKSKQRRWLWGLLAAAVALLGDLLETGILLQITADLADPAEWVGPLVVTTWIKWLALGTYAGLVAVLTLAHAPRRWIIGGVNLAAAVFTILALVAPQIFGDFMALAIGAGWLALWIDSLRAVFKQK